MADAVPSVTEGASTGRYGSEPTYASICEDSFDGSGGDDSGGLCADEHAARAHVIRSRVRMGLHTASGPPWRTVCVQSLARRWQRECPGLATPSRRAVASRRAILD